MTLPLRRRYLAALGLSSTMLSACSAGENHTTPVTTAVTTADVPTAVPPVTATAVVPSPTSKVLTTAGVPFWQPTVMPKGVVLSPTTPQNFPVASCTTGKFCIAEADAGGAEMATAPFSKCATTVSDPQAPNDRWRYVSFDPAQTTLERTAKQEACCYSWVVPCPGGRPLLVEGAPRVAREAPGAEWLASAPPLSWEALRARVSHLPSALREGFADHYVREASFEHASVASFARVSLSLLAARAPADFVAGTHRAALDEITHAEAMYLLASAYRGAAVGPDALDLTGMSPVVSSLEDIAEQAFFEGCVGEVAAALVLREESARASDDVIRTMLATMADDEERHAELAWRTVAWALSRRTGRVRGVLERARAVVDAEMATPIPDEAPTRRGLPGITTAHERAQLRRRALVEVVRPCLDALLSHEAA